MSDDIKTVREAILWPGAKPDDALAALGRIKDERASWVRQFDGMDVLEVDKMLEDMKAEIRIAKAARDALADALRETLRWLKHAKSVSLFCGCRFRHWGDCGTRRLEREIETWDAALASRAPKEEA